MSTFDASTELAVSRGDGALRAAQGAEDGGDAILVVVGAVIGAAAFTLHERHHRRVRDAYSPGVRGSGGDLRPAWPDAA